MNITGVKVLDLDFLNETKYSQSSSPVTILESNGSNRLSKNVTARNLNQEQIEQLTSVLLAWSKMSKAHHSSDPSSRPNGAHSSNGHRSPANSQPINNSKASGVNIQDISVMIEPLWFLLIYVWFKWFMWFLFACSITLAIDHTNWPAVNDGWNHRKWFKVIWNYLKLFSISCWESLEMIRDGMAWDH